MVLATESEALGLGAFGLSRVRKTGIEAIASIFALFLLAGVSRVLHAPSPAVDHDLLLGNICLLNWRKDTTSLGRSGLLMDMSAASILLD